jgi:hypothetical protein
VPEKQSANVIANGVKQSVDEIASAMPRNDILNSLDLSAYLSLRLPFGALLPYYPSTTQSYTFIRYSFSILAAENPLLILIVRFILSSQPTEIPASLRL